MHSVLRVLPSALVLCLASLCAADADLPPIFAPPGPRIPPRTMPAPPLPVSSPTRDRMNTAVHQLLAHAESFAPPAAVGSTSAVAEFARSDFAVVMEPFVVRDAPLQLQHRRPPDPPLLDFLKTGTLYRGPEGAMLSRVALKLMILKQPGLGWGREFTRGEIEFTFRW